MSLHDQIEFIQSIHPFDKLNKEQLNLCQKHMNIGYYPKDTIIISAQNIPEYFFIIIKGEVNEYNSDELSAVYHTQDSFDSDSLIYSKTNSKFIVSEDLICYELDKKIFLDLLNKNRAFKDFYLKDLCSRLQSLKNKEYSNDMSGFMVAKVNEIYLHKPCIVDFNTTIDQAIKKSIEYKTSTIIVQDGIKYGVITDSILKKDLLLKGCDLSIQVKDIAKFPFICVDYDDFLFQVLLVLTKHTIKRVGVLKDGKLIGTLDQIDILSYFANHVHLIAMQIQKAKDINDLKIASQDIQKTVKSLFVKSVKTTYIAKMVAQLNAKVYEKLFDLILPKDLKDKCTLIVMGSEGRNEQILKTDQDNALIIKDEVEVEQFRQYMDLFTKYLIDFGFPRCDGNIMVSNPYWCKSYSSFNQQLDSWLNGTKMEDYMNLAIFFDAKTVAGDQQLLDSLKQKLFSKIDNKDVFMAYFANSTLAFDTPIGIFSNIITKNDEIDLKKGAIFAIVQGVRSLSLENKIVQNSTIARIKKLNHIGVLPKDISSELIEAFGLLLRLKLQAQMQRLNENKPIDNKINFTELTKLQRDMLKDSFQIVNKFKKFITNHFRLNNVM
jgi:CBS domain-containing protein